MLVDSKFDSKETLFETNNGRMFDADIEVMPLQNVRELNEVYLEIDENYSLNGGRLLTFNDC